MPLPDATEFRTLIRAQPAEQVVDDVLFANEAKHVSAEQLQAVDVALRTAFGLDADDLLELIVVGSSKLGYSVCEKRLRSGELLPRYRKFSANSDIDIVVVSQKLYFKFWRELSAYSHAQRPFPWGSGALGDYHVVGWLRPDTFPAVNRPPLCVRWWEVFGGLGRRYFSDRKVRGGLYFMRSFAHEYHRRAVDSCRVAEGL